MNVPSSLRNGTNAAAASRQSAELHVIKTAAPDAENGTTSFRPVRVTNEERRQRKHLSRDEVLTAVRDRPQEQTRRSHAAAIWIAFNHGLRVRQG